MSKQSDIKHSILWFCKQNNISDVDVIADFVLDILGMTGQIEIDLDNEDYYADDREAIKKFVSEYLGRGLTPLAADGLTICQNCGSWLRAGECENCNSPFAPAAKA